MKNSVFAMLALAGLAASATASTVSSTTLASVTFTNKASIDAAGDVDNARDTWIATAGGSVNAIRITGSLTQNNAATFASEAQVRISAGAGQAFASFNRAGSATGAYTGTIAVGPTVITNTPFTLNNGGTVNFEWFESFQDGTAGLAESTWDNVTYDFLSATITNGNFSAGSTVSDGSVSSTNGSNVAGGLDFYSLTLTDGVLSPGHYLNIQARAQTGGSTAYDSELAIYDSAGNLVATDDDGGALNFFSMLTFGASDPNTVGGDLAGSDGAILAAGNYTIVVGGFNTNFTPAIGGIVPGAASGTYALDIRTVPTPGAASLIGLAGLLAARRRRA